MKSTDNSYNNAVENSIDKAFEAVIDEATVLADERICVEYDLNKSQVKFSQVHTKKMKALFSRERRKQKLLKAMVYTKRAACFLLIFAAIMTVAVFSVEAWRIKFMNFVFDADAPDTKISFTDKKQGEIYDGMVDLKYIPEGFVSEESSVSSRMVSLSFLNKDKYFQFRLGKLDVNSAVDTENAVVENITINGYDGIYISKTDRNMLIWHNSSYTYRITANIEKDEIIKIAENIIVK